jgi:glucosyl-dolichyl phosphate glucuronosyltransferase
MRTTSSAIDGESRAIAVSVVIPTFNRAAGVERLLDDLVHQSTSRPYEVIVVDNASTDDTSSIVRRIASAHPLVRYACERARGASHARNRGIALANGPIVAFVDDDIRVAPDWIDALCRAFEGDPSLDCVGGRVAPRWPGTSPPAWLTPAHWPPLALQIDRAGGRDLDRDHASACLVTANFACRATVFQDIGGFSPEFLRDEDRELNLRMWRAGKRGRYDDSIVAFADVQPERLEKRYHRRWYPVTGRSHARLRFREIIGRDGALRELDERRGRYVFGAPGYLYRELVHHIVRWLRLIVARRFDDAFFDECRIRYLFAYVTTRWAAHARGIARKSTATRDSIR